MKKILILILVLFFSSCAVIPKKENKAKNKISDYKDRIEKIAAYHKLDSIWVEKKTIEVVVKEVEKKIIIKDTILQKSSIDSIIINNCKDSILVKEYIYKNILTTKPINYEDSLITLVVLIKPDGVVVDYKLKEQKIKKDVPCEQTIINANIPWHQEKPVRIGFIIIGIIVVITLTRKYL